MNSPFALDRSNAKLFGVCAGLARSTNIDLFGVRMLTVVAAVLLGPVAILFYLIAAMVADNG